MNEKTNYPLHNIWNYVLLQPLGWHGVEWAIHTNSMRTKNSNKQ